jgi:hypothetical protein
MADNDEELKLLREMRDLQQKSLDTQRIQNLLVLSIFALTVIALVLGLTGFFSN